jgi:hypothetical protein
MLLRRSVRVKCPRHPRYNPEREGAGAIRGESWAYAAVRHVQYRH